MLCIIAAVSYKIVKIFIVYKVNYAFISFALLFSQLLSNNPPQRTKKKTKTRALFLLCCTSAALLEQQWPQTAEHPAHIHSIIIILMFCRGSIHVNIEILPFWICNCSSPGATALWAPSSTFNILKTAIYFQFLLFKRNQTNSRTWGRPGLC